MHPNEYGVQLAGKIAGELESGAVTVNDVIVQTAHPATPFGGRGASGWGVTQGPEGLLEMTVPQVVSVRGGSFRPHYDLDDPRQFRRGLFGATVLVGPDGAIREDRLGP